MATILLVEDDDLVKDMLEQTLKRASHDVICACDGIEATEILKEIGFVSNAKDVLKGHMTKVIRPDIYVDDSGNVWGRLNDDGKLCKYKRYK